MHLYGLNPHSINSGMAHCANHEINYLRDMSAQRVQLNTTGRLHIPAALNHNENIQYLAIKNQSIDFIP